jgi:quaternary ammonium compound-resistance protein SugE
LCWLCTGICSNVIANAARFDSGRRQMPGWFIVAIYMAGMVLFVSTIGPSEGMTKLVPSLAAVLGLLMATFGWATIIHNKMMPISIMGVFDSVFMAVAAITVGVFLHGDPISAKRLALLGMAMICVLLANFS